MESLHSHLRNSSRDSMQASGSWRVYKVLTGITNKRTLENFSRAGEEDRAEACSAVPYREHRA